MSSSVPSLTLVQVTDKGPALTLSPSAQDTLAFPQWTQELGIPLYAFWAPILAGTALSILAAAFGWTRAPQPHAIGE